MGRKILVPGCIFPPQRLFPDYSRSTSRFFRTTSVLGRKDQTFFSLCFLWCRVMTGDLGVRRCPRLEDPRALHHVLLLLLVFFCCFDVGFNFSFALCFTYALRRSGGRRLLSAVGWAAGRQVFCVSKATPADLREPFWLKPFVCSRSAHIP